MLGNPADLALIRMQSDGLKPAHMRANYTNVFHALTDITADVQVIVDRTPGSGDSTDKPPACSLRRPSVSVSLSSFETGGKGHVLNLTFR